MIKVGFFDKIDNSMIVNTEVNSLTDWTVN